MSKRLLVLMCAIFLLVPLVFMGCGSDGSDGATGATGPTGPAGPPGANGNTGPAGPGTNTNESCMVCHANGRVADIAVMHPADAAQAVVITVDNVVNDAGKAKVSVHLEDATGAPITAALFAQNRLAFTLSDLVPAGTATNATLGTQSSDYFKRWASESLTTSGAVVDNTDNANGNYVFTFNTGFSTLGTAGVDYADYSYTSATHVQRLVVTFRPLDETLYNRASTTFDFVIPAVGATAVELNTQRMFVTPAVCKKCHGPKMAGAAHGNSYINTTVCVTCHSPFYNAAMHDEGVQASQFFHKIHSAIAVDPPFGTRIKGNGYVDVKFPQDVRNCAICHNNDSGEAVGAGDLTENWRNHPTAAVCGSCHTSVDFITGVGHAGGAQPTDTFCGGCHSATGHYPSKLTGASVTEAHDTSATAVLHPIPANVPEFDVTLTLSPVKAFYVAGDNVTVTATLKFHGTSTEVPASVYTSHGASQIADNLISSASLYIYGPRALPKPIFAPTDNTQGHALFADATDASGTVLTDGTGFRYLFTVPTGLANGTYMIRARFADFGYNRNNSAGGYRVESTYFQNIQIGNATVTPKVAGDACVDCHGSESIHVNDHIAPFNTDECVACHDYSGGHAAVIGNRVHAVHSGNSYGDMTNKLGTTSSRNWDDVTYPQTTWTSSTGAINVQGVARCVTCHASGNTSYLKNVGEAICLGCHGDDPSPVGGGATNHMLQNGGAYPAP